MDILGSPEVRLELVKHELDLLQSAFTKCDDMIWRSRNWCITLWASAIGFSFSFEKLEILRFSVVLPILYFLLEGVLRHQHYYKYIYRYRQIRAAFNESGTSIEDLKLYDITGHYGDLPKASWKRFTDSFIRTEPGLFYISLVLMTVFVRKISG